MIVKVLRALGLSEGWCSLCGLTIEGEEQGYICDRCLEDIKPNYKGSELSIPFLSGYKVFGTYEEVLKEAIRLIKFKSVFPLAHRLGKIISSDLKDYINLIQPDIIASVPTHTFRLWKRGFDHNREILLGAGVETTQLISRIKHAKPLASMDRDKRLKVVKDAFSVKKELQEMVEDKKILIFDDILTTGATSSSVAELLMSLGAREVYFYFVAKEG